MTHRLPTIKGLGHVSLSHSRRFHGIWPSGEEGSWFSVLADAREPVCRCAGERLWIGWQQDDQRPHVERSCTRLLEAADIPVLAWPADSWTFSMFGMFWIGVYHGVFQFLHQCRTPVEEWTNIPQATVNNLTSSVRGCGALVFTPDTDWFPDPPVQ